MSNSSKDSADGAGGPISRRRMLELTAAGSAGVVAGCSGGGNESSTTTTSTTTSSGGGSTTEETTEETTTTTHEYLEVPFRWSVGRPSLVEQELAPYASSTFYLYTTYLNSKGGRHSLTAGETLYYEWDGAPEVDQGAGTMTFGIRDGVKWHSGQEGVIEDFSAKDLVFQSELGRAMVPESERQENPPDVGWHADGDDTFVIELNTDHGYNDAQLANQYTEEYMFTHYRKGIYEGKLEALRDASSQDERDKVRTEVTQISAKIDEKPLSGLWMVDRAAQQRVEFKLQKDHHVADDINFDRMQFKSITGEGNVGYAACRQDQADSCGIPNTVGDGAPSFLQQVVNIAGSGFGQGLIIPYASPADPVYWKDPKVAALVRQAHAYAIDKHQVGENQLSIPSGVNRPPQARFLERQHLLQSDAMAKDVLGDDYESFPTYEQDQDKAEQKLRQAGFTKDGGTWYKPDGNKVALEIQTFGWTTKAGQTVVSNLGEIGYEASVVKMNNTQLVSKFWGQKEYTSTIAETNAHSGPPSVMMKYWWDPGEKTLPPGSEDREAKWSKYPVPPIGDLDAEPTEKVDTLALIKKFNTTPEAELTEDVKRLAWVNAYHLPNYAMYLNPNEFGMNAKHFAWPEPKPDFPEKWGGNYGIATGAHNPVYGVQKNRHSITKGYGAEYDGGETSIQAREQ